MSTETYIEYRLETRKGDGEWNRHGGDADRSLEVAQEKLARSRTLTAQSTELNPVNADVKHRIVARTVTVTPWEPID